MVYLSIKELANTAEDIIMVTSSIQKDTQPNLEVIYRPNAIRALCRIIDASHSYFCVAEMCIGHSELLYFYL
jgi:coatomer subunit gamma